jgi:putative flavoprotein involved in K+ transport
MTSLSIDDCLDVLVVGAGQSGLALAWHLARQNARFLVVDGAAGLGASWASRWDSLRLFTPAQYDALPGMAFPAAHDTYPTKDQVAAYLSDYATRFELPVLRRCRVHRVERTGDHYAVHTSQGMLRARQVVVATGAFHRPVTPTFAAELPSTVAQVHSAAYRNPTTLPAGPTVVVGTGNSGLQNAEELSASRPVYLATGRRALELPQRLWGRDLFWYLTTLGLVTRTADSLLARRMRSRGDLVIGSRVRDLARRGVVVKPRTTGASADGLHFTDGSTVAPAAVVWATGFAGDYSWIDVPGVVVDGSVVHQRGTTAAPGLYFIGLPWQHTRGSALLGFVRYDAEWLARRMAAERVDASLVAARA